MQLHSIIVGIMAKTLYSKKTKEDNVMLDWFKWVVYEVYRYILI